MNLMPLASALEAAGLGKKGETIFVGMLPAEVETAILLRSPLIGTKIDYELPNYYRADFQLIVRSPAGNYAAGETLIKSVIERLTVTDSQVEGMTFSYCRPRTKPVAFPLSKGNLVEFNVTFDCCFVEA